MDSFLHFSLLLATISFRVLFVLQVWNTSTYPLTYIRGSNSVLYLEEKYPQHPLFPSDLAKKALNFQEYIEEKVSPDEKIPWTKFHIEKGFEALEKLLKDHAGRYATRDEVYMVNL
ncbi:hypothetical protein GOBAR_AA15639 [Gossypium barbadense]|uniref:Uncharacterized protein n=1 Tax=Gossypium barbadense TaxID=3634 RepID=A0A2P5XNW5_GOSBA|nr:hypothetical protein GOBAR_AA15639 [Gossypium barbadense]